MLAQRWSRRIGCLVMGVLLVVTGQLPAEAAGGRPAGPGPAPAAAGVAPVATRLSITAGASTVSYQSAVTISGKLTRADNRAGVAGRSVRIYQKSPAATGWTSVGVVTTTSGGAYSMVRRPSARTMYTARAAAGTTTRSSASSNVTVGVWAPLFDGILTPASSTAGVVRDVRTWSGRTTVRAAGRSTLVQQFVGSTWRTVATRPISTRGTFAVPFRTSTSGSVKYRLVLPGVPDHFSSVATPSVTLVTRAMTFRTTSLPGGTLGRAYSAPVTMADARKPVIFTWSGAAPPGLVLSATTGVISGTPTKVGSHRFVISARDANGQSASRTFTVTVVVPPVPAFVDTALPSAQRGVGYHYLIRTTYGVKPFTWTVLSGALPAGLALDRVTGLLTGTPTVTGRFQVTVRAAAAAGSVSRTFELVVGDPHNWNQEHGQPGGTGANPDESSITADTVARVRLEARLPVGDSSPFVVADGVLYTSGSLPESLGPAVAAYDVASGAELWSVPLDRAGCTDLAVVGEVIACRAGNVLLAIRRSGSHDVAWSTVDETFAADHGLVVVGDRLVTTATVDGHRVVRAIAAGDGSVTWQRTWGEVPRQSARDVVVDGDRVFVLDGSDGPGRLRAFSLTDGPDEPLWEIGEIEGGKLLAADGHLYLCDYDALTRIDPSSGSVGWRFTTEQAGSGSFLFAAADGGKVYVGTDDNGVEARHGILALDVTDPAGPVEDWFVPGAVHRSPTLQQGLVWALSEGGIDTPPVLRAIDAETGAVRRTIATPGLAVDSAVPANGRVVVGTGAETLIYGLAPPAPSVTTRVLPAGWVGGAYRADLAAAGGTAPYVWSLVPGSGGLPAGVSLSGARLTGTPSKAGISTFVVRATDAAGRSVDRQVRLRVSSPASATWPTWGGSGLLAGDGSADRAFTPASAATFEQKWHTPAVAVSGLPSGYDGAEPVVDGSRVFGIGPDGVLRWYALATPGAAPTRTVRPPGTGSRSRFIGTPTVHDGVVRVATVDGSSTRVAAYQIGDGRQLWLSDVVEYASITLQQAPLVAAGRVVVRTGDALVGIDDATGAIAWRVGLRPLDHSAVAVAATDGTRVFVADGSDVVAVAAHDGQELWRATPTPTPGCSDAPVRAVAVHRDGTVYAGSCSRVAALAAADGSVRWSTPVPLGMWLTVTDTAVVVVGGGNLSVIDRLTGAFLHRRPGGDLDVGVSGVAAAGDLFVLRGTDGALVAIDPSTLATVWSTPVPPMRSRGDVQYSLSRPVVAAGRIYLYANDGTIRVYGP